MASEAITSQGLGRRGSDLETPFETRSLIPQEFPGKRVGGKKERAVGGVSLTSSYASEADIDAQPFIGPQEKIYLKYVFRYEHATTKQEQRDMFRGWLNDARAEVDKEERGQGNFQSLERKITSKLFLVSNILDSSKTQELDHEQRVAWNFFRAGDAMWGATDQKEAAVFTGGIRGKEEINFAFREIKHPINGGITVADAIDKLDEVVRREVAGGSKSLVDIFEIAGPEVTTFLGGDFNAKYLTGIALDMFVVGSRPNLYNLKDTTFKLAKIIRFDKEITSANGLSSYVKNQIDRIPAVIGDYWTEAVNPPKNNLVAPAVRGATISPKMLAENPAYELNAAVLKGTDFGPALKIKTYYINEMTKASTIVAEAAGGGAKGEIAQIYAQTPGAGMIIISQAVSSNSFLQELDETQKSAFIEPLGEIAIEHQLPPKLGYTGVLYDKSRPIAWNEAKAAKKTDAVLKGLQKRPEEKNVEEVVENIWQGLTQDDKELLRQKFYPNRQINRRVEKGKTVAGVVGRVAAETALDMMGNLLKNGK